MLASASRGGLLPGGVSAPGGGGIPACTEADPPPVWTESQTPVKTLPWPNFVAAGNNMRNKKCHFYSNYENNVLPICQIQH